MRKQNDYLAGLLTDDAPAEATSPLPRPATPERQRGLSLLSRETTLARVASGEVKQVTQLALDPARVRVWAGNARAYGNLNETACRDLIDSIIAEGGQKVPAIVRRVESDDQYDYEVIAGTRRHWAISWLRTNSYPDMVFVAQVHVLDDEAAFRIADIENRARKDVSDIERARNYAIALKAHYGGQQSRMAERLNISKGWLSKLIKVTHIDDCIFAAFADISEVSLAGIYPLAQSMDDAAFAKAALVAAKAIATEQQALRDAKAPPLPAPEVIRRLRSARQATSGRQEPYTAASRYGRTVLSIAKADRQGVTLRLHNGSGASRDEAITAVKAALDWLDGEGRGLSQ